MHGIQPECCFNIHFKPPLLRTDSNGKCCIAILAILVVIISVLLQGPLQEEHSFHWYHHPHHHIHIRLIHRHHWIVWFSHRDFYKMVILKIPSKWKTFGIMLEIYIERLERILFDKRSPEDCLLEVYRIG